MGGVTISVSVFAVEPSTPLRWVYVVDEALRSTWASTDYELYIPVNTWHNRGTYSDAQLREFNERPWGLGVGKSRYDEDGDWHALYAMVFLDSQGQYEPIVGYGYQKIWQMNEAIKLGAGFTVGITLRDDMQYWPVPVILPLVSIRYKAMALQSTYVPGPSGHGNVLFTWICWAF